MGSSGGLIKQASRRLFLFLDANGALRVYVELLLAAPLCITFLEIPKGRPLTWYGVVSTTLTV
jgi:hypothetical protein